MSHYQGKTMQHEHSESQQVKTRQRLGQALVVAYQAAETADPGQAALNDPATLPLETFFCF